MYREFLTNYSAQTKGVASKMADAISGQSLTSNTIHHAMIDVRDEMDRQIETSINMKR